LSLTDPSMEQKSPSEALARRPSSQWLMSSQITTLVMGGLRKALASLRPAIARARRVASTRGRWREGAEIRRFGIRELLKFIGNYQGYRRVFARNCVFDIAGRFTSVVAVDSRGIRYFVNTADKGISRDVFGQGSYGDRDLMKVVLEFLARTCGHPGDLRDSTFLDIGANIGTSTIAALTDFHAEAAAAVEPHPDHFTLLQHNLLANELTDRVRALRIALSDREGEVELELAKLNLGDSRVRVEGHQRGNACREHDRRVVRVKAMTLDQLIADHTVNLDRTGLVWMDVQGHEGHVLDGAQQLLRSEVPVVIEYWPYGLQNANALERLHRLVIEHYNWIVDTYDSSSLELRPAADIAELARIYGRSPIQHTNLILLKRCTAPAHSALP
jgi:FkbM family methyltransferase